MKKVKKQMLNVVLFTLLFVIIACVTIGTYAWFTDQKSFSTNELKFGTITLNVTGDSISGENLNVVVTRSVGDLTGQLMPGDTVSLKFNVTLNTGCEPAYYLVYLTGAEDLFDESGCFYKSGDGTDATIVYPTSESKTVGALSTTAHTFNLTKQISTSYETQGESVSITLAVYAIQQANLTQEEAFDELYKRYYTTNGVQFSSFSVSSLGISGGSGLTSLGFYKTSDFEALDDFASYSIDSTCTTAMNSSLVGEAVNYDLVKVYKTSTAVAVVSDTTIFAPESCRSIFPFSGLKSISFKNFDTSRVTTMNSMFAVCGSLTSLDVSAFDTSKVTDMTSMFEQCGGLIELDVSNFNTSNVTSMYRMFYMCMGMTNLNLSSFETSKVKNMSYMMCWCNKLTNIDLSSFKTSNAVNMSGMFSDCTNLTEISVGDGWVVSSDCDTTDMFKNCGVSSVTKK